LKTGLKTGRKANEERAKNEPKKSLSTSQFFGLRSGKSALFSDNTQILYACSPNLKVTFLTAATRQSVCQKRSQPLLTEIEKTLADGYAVIIYPNRLGTATMVLADGDDWVAIQNVIDEMPEERVVDVTRPTGPEAVEAGVAKLGRKLRREGEYENFDEKMRELGLPNPAARPPHQQEE
jgi:hypothetical protein